jgi:DNA mismatch endonuclease (patch repair protein)
MGPDASVTSWASSPGVRRAMRSNRRTGTSPELRLRSALHRHGLRFRKDLRIVEDGQAVRPDIVFTRARVAVFCDGCFWHGCPEHGTSPRTNADFWSLKLAGNKERDERNNALLRASGWEVIRVWEHEDTYDAARRVERAVADRLGRLTAQLSEKSPVRCRLAIAEPKSGSRGSTRPARRR